MALVKYGGGVTQMSGSIGGTTFARNASGNYARARTKPVNPQTALQTVVRAAFAFLTDRWAQILTANQRTAWNLYGSSVPMQNKLGETIFLTGFSQYIRSNMIRKQLALPVIDDGPVIFEIPDQDPTFAITASEATQQITYSFDIGLEWALEADGWILVFQGKPQNAQRNFFAGPWRVISATQGADPGPIVSPVLIATSYAIAEGQRQWSYARIARADGRLSEVFRADTFCAA